MNVSAATILSLALIAYAEAARIFGLGEPWKLNGLKAKYSPLPINSYYNLPKSTNDTTFSEYEEVEAKENNLKIPASLWCQPNDPRICMIFDRAGNNVGIQISFLDQDTQGVEGYDFSAVNSFTRTNIYELPANSFRVYYTNPEKLTEAGRSPSNEVIDGVFVYIRGELIELPRYDPKVQKYGHFYRQACIPQMGQHYFFEIANNETDCTQHVPFFGLYHNKQLVGFGMASYGKSSSANGGREWYETIPLFAARLILPSRPQCIDRMITANGIYSLHVYFVENPYLITCILQ